MAYAILSGTGRLGADPVIHQNKKSGKKLAVLSVAEDAQVPVDGKYVRKVQWLTVIVTSQALIKSVVEPYLQKGSLFQYTATPQNKVTEVFDEKGKKFKVNRMQFVIGPRSQMELISGTKSKDGGKETEKGPSQAPEKLDSQEIEQLSSAPDEG